jgi:hypothetical protein
MKIGTDCELIAIQLSARASLARNVYTRAVGQRRWRKSGFELLGRQSGGYRPNQRQYANTTKPQSRPPSNIFII